tara:strand:- start:289 stop:1425 length:1137 start_codon:yes stop_codon:yes gene_type:complete
MATIRRRTGVRQTPDIRDKEQSPPPPVGMAMTVGNLGMKVAEMKDTAVKTKVTESGILNNKVSDTGANVQYNVFETTPPDKGMGWLRPKGDRIQLNTEVSDALKVFEKTGEGVSSEVSNPGVWEKQLADAGFSETEIAKEFGYESADAFANAKATNTVELKLSDGTTYTPEKNYFSDVVKDAKLPEGDVLKAGELKETATSQFQNFIYGSSGIEGQTISSPMVPDASATIGTVGKSAVNPATGELVTHTVSGTQLASGGKVMTLANGNAIPLSGKALAVEKATITAVKGGADAASASASASTAKASVGAKVFGDVAGAHAAAKAAGATAAEVAAAGAAAITPVGWTLIALAIVAAGVEITKRDKKKKKRRQRRAGRRV